MQEPSPDIQHIVYPETMSWLLWIINRSHCKTFSYHLPKNRRMKTNDSEESLLSITLSDQDIISSAEFL